MFVEPAFAIKQALEIFEERKAIELFVKKLVNRIRKGTLRVPVFGLGGTGKSTLGSILSGKLNPYSGPKTYKESLATVDFEYDDERACTLIVPPGQEWRRAYFWPQLFRMLSQGRAGAIVNVVAYGYHSLSALKYPSFTNYSEIYQDGMDAQSFASLYLKDRRNAELASLKSLVPHLSQAPGRLWMVTLVTKQDLWWRSRAEVRDHYEQGTYNEYIEAIRDALGDKFMHEYLSACLVESNFVTGTGECLANTAAGYDSNVQSANLMNFVESFRELVRS